MAKIKQGERPTAKGTSHTVKPNVDASKQTKVKRKLTLDRKARAR